MLYVHTNVTDMLDLTQIAKEFVSVNSRRIILEKCNFCTVNVSFMSMRFDGDIIIIIIRVSKWSKKHFLRHCINEITM